MHPVIALALVMVAGIAATRLPRFPNPPAMFDAVVAARSHLLLAGFVLGPLGGVLDAATLRVLTPVTVLGIGWLGGRFGARFEWRWVRRLPWRVWVRALVQAAVAFAAVSLATALLARVIPALRLTWPAPRPSTILALGALAAVSAPELVALLARRRGAAPTIVRKLNAAATLDSALGAIAFVMVIGARQYGIVAGLPIALGAGVLAGALFAWLGRLLGPDDPTLLLMGVLLVSAGAGYAAGVSPFFTSAIALAVAIQLLPRRRFVIRRLVTWERAILSVFMILAGALLGMPTAWIVPLTLALVAGRLALRWLPPPFRSAPAERAAAMPDPRLAGIPQGGAVVALAVGWHIAHGPETTALLTTIVLSVVVTQLIAGAWMARAARLREV